MKTKVIACSGIAACVCFAFAYFWSGPTYSYSSNAHPAAQSNPGIKMDYTPLTISIPSETCTWLLLSTEWSEPIYAPWDKGYAGKVLRCQGGDGYATEVLGCDADDPSDCWVVEQNVKRGGEIVVSHPNVQRFKYRINPNKPYRNNVYWCYDIK